MPARRMARGSVVLPQNTPPRFQGSFLSGTFESLSPIL
jgi:hypothetical protein